MIIDRRFSGLTRLFGSIGALRICNSHVVIIGVGGVGSWTAEALARSGVGRITLIDLDHVSESNINRQIQATEATVGQAKVLAMRERIHSINPDCNVICIEEFVALDNWPSLLPEGITAVIDACDQVKVKTLLAAWALTTDISFITVGAAGGKRHAHLVDIEDLSKVTHDPLLSQVRYSLRKHHGSPREGKKIGITCVFSREAVSSPDAATSNASTSDGSLNCHGYGSLVSVTATFGQCAAGWILNESSK